MPSVSHTPKWEPADLPVDAAGNTRPGFVCTYEMENGNRCVSNVFTLDQAIGDHSCIVPDLDSTPPSPSLAAETGTEPAWLAEAVEAAWLVFNDVRFDSDQHCAEAIVRAVAPIIAAPIEAERDEAMEQFGRAVAERNRYYVEAKRDAEGLASWRDIAQLATAEITALRERVATAEQSTSIIRRAALEELGGFTVSPHYIGEDNQRIHVEHDAWGCRWTMSFPGLPGLRRVAMSKLTDEIREHLDWCNRGEGRRHR